MRTASLSSAEIQEGKTETGNLKNQMTKDLLSPTQSRNWWMAAIVLNNCIKYTLPDEC